MSGVPWRCRAISVLAAAILSLPACGRNAAVTTDPELNLQQFELHEIGSAYALYLTERGQPPTGVNDLLAYEVGFPNGLDALQNGRCVAVWGLDLARLPAPASTILAYKTEVPVSGGFVLRADQTIRKMTAEEFKSLVRP